MKIQRLENNCKLKRPSFQAVTQTAFQKTAKTFAKMGDIGEGTSIACDFFGKALVVPLVIMATSKEPQDKKEFSAFKNPVAAVIQLALEVPILAAGSKIIGECANKGMFDLKGSNFSYNEKLKRTKFINVFQKYAPSLKEKSKGFLDEVKSKGYSNKIIEQFDDITANLNEPTKKIIKGSFKEYEKTYKNLFHLKNRLCFAAALVLTPLLCALENKIHPAIMDKIFKLQHLDRKKEVVKKPGIFDDFIKTTNGKRRTV